MLTKLARAFSLLRQDLTALKGDVQRIEKVRQVVKNGKDGVSPTAAEVAKKMPNPQRGKTGAPGKNGVSVTDVQLNNNELFVFLDGKKSSAGKIKMPAATAPFRPGGEGGGGSGGGAATPTPTVNNELITYGFTTQMLADHDGTVGTETVLDFGTASSDVYDVAGGVVTLLKDVEIDHIVIEIHVSKGVGLDAIYTSWVEISTDNGVSYSPVTGSLRKMVMATDGADVFISDLSTQTPASTGDKFRVVATNTGAASIEVIKPDDLVASNGTVTGFATKILLK